MKCKLLMVALFFATISQAQVKDISLTFSPVAEHVWWDNQAGLGDNFLFGGKVGFGFGEYLELSGVFLTSEGMQTDFSSFSFNDFDATNFDAQDIRLKRWGGEAKINFSSSAISPYATFGTGIQKIQLSSTDSSTEQIYASFGLGLRFALTNRINFLLEGRATGFSSNPVNSLLTLDQIADLGINVNQYNNENLLNFSALAALQIYLGGRKPGELSALDKAYLEKYKGGFKGWSLVFEPSLAYANFDSNSLYRDTWLAGAYFGTDFNEYVGVRTYYYQGLSDERISTDSDRLNMYGLELRAKLNNGNGVIPYLILGGGRLNIQSGYLGSVGGLTAQSSNFANAGLGLDIPLGRNLLITGGFRAMATSGVDSENIIGQDVLQTHVMYNAGVKIQLGKKVKISVTSEDLIKDKLQSLEEKLSYNDDEYKRLNKLKKAYELEIDKLNENLEKAYQNKNTKQAVGVLEDKKRVEQSLVEVLKLQRLLKTPEKEQGEYYKMTPVEFENLIDRILQGLDEKYNPKAQSVVDEEPMNNELLMRLIQLEQNAIRKGSDLFSNEKTVQLLIEALVNERKESKQLPESISTPKDVTLTINTNEEKKTEVQKSTTEANIKAEEEMMKIVKQNLEDSKKREDELKQRMETLEKELMLFKQRTEKQQKAPSENTKLSTKKDEDETKEGEKESSKKKTTERKVLIKSANSGQNVGHNFVVLEKSSWMWNKLSYKGMAAFTGFNFGDQTIFNVGVRGHYGIGNTRFELLPEAFVGFDDPTAYGGQLNIIYPFAIDKENGLKAYVGAGGGFLEIAGSTNMNYNFVLGSYLNVFKGRLFVDYSIRNMFGNNSFSLGYRLPF